MEINEGKTETMKLTDREALILRDLCYARMKVLKAWNPESAEKLPVHHVLAESTARQAAPVFDFFQSAMAGKEEAVKRQAAAQKSMGPYAGGEYYDGMIGNYQNIMHGLMDQGHYTAEEVVTLQNRIKGFIKAQKTTPSQILYIADCHFYHDRICREMDNRGFPGFREMNEHMMKQWNRKVRPRDEVYILGDFSISRGDATEKVLDQLKGKLHLIVGNHDRYLEDKLFEEYHWFHSVEHYQEIRDKGRNVILSHYPVFCYKGQYRRDNAGNPLTYMLYGHVHNTHDEVLINRFIMETRRTKVVSRHSPEPEPIPCNMINCFCMFSDYQPMTLDEWIVIDRKRREKISTPSDPSYGSAGSLEKMEAED